MTINVTEQSDLTTKIVIDGEMTIYAALEQSNALMAHLKAGVEVQIDLSQVSEIDSAGTQLLMNLKKESTRLKSELRLINHSEAVVEVVELLGLTSYFGDPIIIPASWGES